MSYLVRYHHHQTNCSLEIQKIFESYIQYCFVYVFILYLGASRKIKQPNDKIIYGLVQQPDDVPILLPRMTFEVPLPL